jgi:hypothetical protein
MKFEKNNFNAIIIAGALIGLAILIPQIINQSNATKGSETKSYIASNQNTNSGNSNEEECNIKGNINSSGDRIYHVPGGSYYDKTQISTSNGERYFCSEQEAIDSGWRKSKR